MEVKITNTAILSCIAEDYWKPVIETDLTEEEHAMIADGERKKNETPPALNLGVKYAEVKRRHD